MRTDLGEMALLSAAATLTKSVSPALPSLLGSTTEDLRSVLAGLDTPDQFARVSRSFFTYLIYRSLEYYLSRAYADHIGPYERFTSLRAHKEFRRELEVHCFEAALIVERYSRDWFSKKQFKGGITPEAAARFSRTAFRKLRIELRRRSGADG